MSVINTNITSLIGQSNLSKSQSALQTSMERLSSGLRINSAKDDAAGQAIANDGISIAQTAEGSLNQVNDNLQRIRELTVQAQNGTNSSNDLQSIQDEINQRLDEIDRISKETDFNGVRVLSENTGLTIQVGANDGQTITVNLQEINSSTLGMDGFSVSKNTLNVSEAITQVEVAADQEAVAVDLSAAAEDLDVDASSLSLRNILDADGNATSNYVVKSGEDFYAASIGDDGAVTLNKADLAFTDPDASINDAVDLEDQLVRVGTNEEGETTAFVNVQGGNYAIEAGALASNLDDNFDSGTTVVLSGDGATAEFAGASTTSPLAKIDEALNKVDSLRSELGAVQNRFEDAITNLNTNETNLASARSRIEDADYAVEVANMTRAQILQQAGTSVLAQANQIPQNVLSLLG